MQHSFTPEKPTPVSLSEENELAFSQLYDEHFGAMFKAAKKILRSQELAEDVVHDVFLKLISMLEKDELRRVETMRWYVTRMTINASLKRLDVKKRRCLATKEYLFTADVSDHIPEEQQEPNLRLVAKLINALSPPLRKAFLLVKVDGLTEKDASEQLAISSDALRKRLYRATLELRRQARQVISVILVLLFC